MVNLRIMDRHGENLGSEEPYGQTLAEYSRMMIRNPRSFVFVSMADTCLRAGKPKLALEVLERGLRHHPNLASALTLKGRALMELGRPGEAREPLLRAVGGGENVLARKLLAQLCLESGEPEKGLELFDEIRRLWPGYEPPQPLMEQLKQAAGTKPQTDAPTKQPRENNGRRDEAISTLERWLDNATRMAKG